MSELTDLIDKLVVEKTLSFEAIDKVKELKDKAEDLEGRLGDVENDNKHLGERSMKLSDENGELRATIANWEKRENSLNEREGKISELEKCKAIAEAVSASQKQMFETIFKNVTVRRSVNKSVPVADHTSGYISSHPESEDSEETEE
jgi:septal ring factor EnvC (AmiA/AmiB activator)